MGKLRYSEFRERIDVDALEQAIGFTSLDTNRNGWDSGHCIWPEHHANGDTTGKFGINRDHKTYNCFVCGGGSLLSLAMEVMDLDVDDATEWLYQFTDDVNVHSNADFELQLLRELAEDINRGEAMPYFNERVLERFNDHFYWFLERGITDDVVEEYNLRASATVMKSAPVENGKKIDNDYIGPAIIFPHYWNDHLVGWQHRWLHHDAKETPRWLPKYTMTTDFPKHNTLFNYHKVKKTTAKILVCESVSTVLFLASLGHPAVSYFGGEITPVQLRLLRQFGQGVILCPDNDAVGDKLLATATSYLERFLPVWHLPKVKLGPKADLGDFAQADNPAMRVHEFILRAYQPREDI